MDYIAGQCLDSCWNLPEPERQDALSLQVARIIEQLQCVQLLVPGPLSGGVCRGQVFTDYGDGPFESSTEITEWINFKVHVCKDLKELPPDMPDFQSTSFVLTHQDISPRNLILDSTDRIWLIDWGDAGTYPPCFEVAALHFQRQFQDFLKKVVSHLNFDRSTIERFKAIHACWKISLMESSAGHCRYWSNVVPPHSTKVVCGATKSQNIGSQ